MDYSQQWTAFLDRCFKLRVRSERFQSLAPQLHERAPLKGRKIADALLRPRRRTSSTSDPLVIAYLDSLLSANLVDAADVLIVAFKYSRDRPTEPAAKDDSAEDLSIRHTSPAELDELILGRLTSTFRPGDRPRSSDEARKALDIVAMWMSAMVTSHNSDSVMQAMAGGVHHPTQQAIGVREGLGQLAITLLENPKVMEVIATSLPNNIRKNLIRSISMFIPFLAQTQTANALHISQRLEIEQKHHGLIEEPNGDVEGANQSGNLEVAAIQLESVIDLPLINTRAGLYIFLNALLVGRPLTDDHIIINYLHMRYKGDIQNMSIDLITASFDVLSNAMYRNEHNHAILSYKSFLVNKIPILLTLIAPSMFAPLTPEFCITQALSHVDTNAFPSFSQAFDMTGSGSLLSDVRQDFLIACALHGLVAVQNIPRLLGEPPMSGLPETGKLMKDDLVAQCSANIERTDKLLNDLERIDGNAVGIVEAITEVIRNLCASKETMSLKTVCNSLSRRPQALDIMLQFTSPASILHPVCELLDQWRYEDDQGEYQPIYDEFGAILLLVLAFVHRFELTRHDIGLPPDNFVSQLLESGYVSLNPDQLTEEQDRHMLSWFRGLFDQTMGDEIMSSCRPQEFYLLVPTIISQTVFACSSGVLTLETVKGGIDYLLETFLLPSLVGALSWLTTHALQRQDDLDITVQLLRRMICPSSISGDAQSMHGTILAIVARPLDHCLRTLRRRDPARQALESLIEAIKPHVYYERTALSSPSELRQWTGAPRSNIQLSIKGMIQQLVLWNSTSGISPTPPAYTHRLVISALKLNKAKKVLRAIIEEVKAQTEAGQGAAALDIATSIICAPCTIDSPLPITWIGSPTSAPQPIRRQQNLREMLKAEFDSAAECVATDPLTAETIVRLHRRVEAQLAVDVAPLPDVSVNVNVNAGAMGQATDPMMAMEMDNLNAADTGGVGLGHSLHPHQQQHQHQLDLGRTDGGAGMDLGGGAGAVDGGTGGLDLGNGLGNDMLGTGGGGMGDIFDGLDLDEDMDWSKDL